MLTLPKRRLTNDNYKKWPIFYRFNKTKTFQDAYQKKFKKKFKIQEKVLLRKSGKPWAVEVN